MWDKVTIPSAGRLLSVKSGINIPAAPSYNWHKREHFVYNEEYVFRENPFLSLLGVNLKGSANVESRKLL